MSRVSAAIWTTTEPGLRSSMPLQMLSSVVRRRPAVATVEGRAGGDLAAMCSLHRPRDVSQPAAARPAQSGLSPKKRAQKALSLATPRCFFLTSPNCDR